MLGQITEQSLGQWGSREFRKTQCTFKNTFVNSPHELNEMELKAPELFGSMSTLAVHSVGGSESRRPRGSLGRGCWLFTLPDLRATWTSHLLSAGITGNQLSLEVLGLNQWCVCGATFLMQCLLPASLLNKSKCLRAGWGPEWRHCPLIEVDGAQKNALGLATTQLLLHCVCLQANIWKNQFRDAYFHQFVLF